MIFTTVLKFSLIFILISFASASNVSDSWYNTVDKPFICNKVFYFLLEKNNNYTNQDISIFSESLSDLNITSELLSFLVSSYEVECFHYTKINISKLFFNNPQYPAINKSIEFCKIDLNKSFLGFDLDTSINVNPVLINLPCENIEKYRYFVDFDRKESDFLFTGVKIYWILAILFLIIMYLLFRDGRIIKRIGGSFRRRI